MDHDGIRRGILAVLAATLLMSATAGAASLPDEDAGGPRLLPDQDLVLPDGRPVPPLPVRLLGSWDNKDGSITTWQADLDIDDDDQFAGKISYPTFALMVPLTVQGTREGDIVEFSVRFEKNEVAYFAGHVAGTSLVGTVEGITGQEGVWSGSWLPQTLEDRPVTTADDGR